MTKILKVISTTVIILFILSFFGWMVFHISKDDKNFGFLTGPIKFMYTFPDQFSRSVEEVQTLPKTFVKTPADFEPINKLDTNIIALSTYSDTSDSRSIVLWNLKNDSVLYKWTIKNPYQEHDRILNPILLPHKNLVLSFDGKALMRIDSLSKIIWKRDTIWAHHAFNMDNHGNLWLCTFPPVFYATGLYKLNGRSVFYKDNSITKVDAETGKILFQKSVTQILRENNLSHYLIKAMAIRDPIHINDVEPALKTTPFYKEGDVFISARQPSFILHYRPSTNKVLQVIEGPFVSQHDVDILNDHTLVCFNNNYYDVSSSDSDLPPHDSLRLSVAGDFYSDIVSYDLANHTFSFIGDSIFRANKIFSFTESLVDFLDPDTYFVEEQNTSILWIIKNNQVIYKNVFKSQHEGYHHLSNWTRIIKNYE